MLTIELLDNCEANHTLEWHVGEDTEPINRYLEGSRPFDLYADGDELAHILSVFSAHDHGGLPIARDKQGYLAKAMAWPMPWSRLIWLNL